MDITINNRPEFIKQDKITIYDILKLKNYTFKMLVIKVNGELIKKPHYTTTTVVDDDDVQIIHMISGG